MKPTASFFSRIIPYAPGCSEPMAAMMLVDAAIDFCEHSKIVERLLGETTTVAGQAVYEFDLPPGQTVALVNRVWIDGNLLGAAAATHNYANSYPNGSPTHFLTSTQEGVLELLLAPTPDVSGQTLTIKAALCPTRDATELDDILYENWAEALAAGALARLCAMPAQQFTDTLTATMMAQRFTRLRHLAKAEALRGRTPGTISTVLRPLA